MSGEFEETAESGPESRPESALDSAHDSAEEVSLRERRRQFGEWLRMSRKQAQITQSELASRLGYDSSQLISNIERGVSLLPSRKLPEFARALGCSLLEMEIRYFQCSAKNSAESRMPSLLLKYLPLIEVLEYGQGSTDEVLAAISRLPAMPVPQR